MPIDPREDAFAHADASEPDGVPTQTEARAEDSPQGQRPTCFVVDVAGLCFVGAVG
jgi:hypothetical protein